MITPLARKLTTVALALSLCAAQAALAAPQLHRPPRARRAHRFDTARPDATNDVTMPKLSNEGGRVLTQANIVAVLWGPPDDPLPSTIACDASTFRDCIDGYLQNFLNDPQFDWITEYNVGSSHISRAVYGGIFQITPTIATGSTVGESDIESEIANQISDGNLPTPDVNNQTIYEIFFSLAVMPSDPGSVACCDFCAYHDSYNSNTIGGAEVMFGIFPSAVPGGYPGTCSGEDYGPDCSECGERADWFQNLGGSISHEIFETITDPDIGIHSVGWYDENNEDAMSAHGEVADMCEGFNDASLEGEITEETFTAPDGGSYTVQRLWSNAHNACLADDSGAFSINNSTRTQAIKAPKNATTNISLPSTGTLSAGELPISYTLHWGAYPDAGLPTGVTATFAPATPETGENTVLALAVGNNAPTNFVFGVAAENGISQAQTIVKINSGGANAPDAGTPGAQTDGGTGGQGGGSAGGSAGGSGGGSAGGSGGGSAGGSAGGSGGGSAGGSAGGSGGGSAGGSAGGSGGGSAGGSAGGSGGGSAGGSAGGSGGGSAGGSAGGAGGGSAGGAGGGSGSTGGFTASISPSILAVSAGSTAQAVLTTTAGTASGHYTLTSTSVPGLSISPTSGTLGTPLTLTLTAAAGAPSASANFTLTLTASGSTGTAITDLVLSGDDASIFAPATVSVAPGGSATFTVSSDTVDGHAQELTLSSTGLPSGATVTFTPTTITSSQSAMATVSVPASQAVGNVAITIVGQGPIARVSAPVSLEVAVGGGGGGTASSGGCASPGVFPLALLGLIGLGRRRRKLQAA